MKCYKSSRMAERLMQGWCFCCYNFMSTIVWLRHISHDRFWKHFDFHKNLQRTVRPIECIHELEVLAWLRGDYSGNYSGNIGPSCNLLITNSSLLSTRYPTFSYIIIIIILFNYGIHLSSDQFSMSVRQVSKRGQGSRPCQGRQFSQPVLLACMCL